MIPSPDAYPKGRIIGPNGRTILVNLVSAMKQETILSTLQPFLNVAGPKRGFPENPDGQRILGRLSEMNRDPVHVTALNQLLHLVHEAGVTPGFFKYYFQVEPSKHPYPVDKVMDRLPPLDEKGISSLRQLEWGLRRFFIDALLYSPDLRSAYRELRTWKFEDIASFFEGKRYDSESMKDRGPVLRFHSIPVDDRYLISEVACKAYSATGPERRFHIEQVLLSQYLKTGGGKTKIGTLFDPNGSLAREEPHEQMMLEFLAEEIMEEQIESEDDIRSRVGHIATRFANAREQAIENTRLYLSIVNELDVYVATSMRRRDDFRNMANDCKEIFSSEGLSAFRVRYFDPTMSAAEGHEDKGLIECLMVKCAKVVLYFAGESDSFGKDAEIAMAMSLGKPVIILCPDTKKGEQRERFFRDIHPLSRLIHFDSGVTIGAMVTRRKDIVAQVLERILDNRMEYNLEITAEGYLRLRERLTESVVRLQTNWRLLREAFWNYYHGVA